MALSAVPAAAATILSPVLVVSNTGGTTCGGDDCSVERTIDHSGLLTDFTSGVTDFDTYIAGNPLHDLAFLDQEWFSSSGIDSATVVYDLGGLYSISRLAYWNEDAEGVSRIVVSACSDATCAVALNLGAFSPTDNPIDVDYPAEVFALTPALTQFVRIQFFEFGDNNRVSVGELAFDASAQAVPEPGTLLLVGGGAAAWFSRRRRSRRA